MQIPHLLLVQCHQLYRTKARPSNYWALVKIFKYLMVLIISKLLWFIFEWCFWDTKERFRMLYLFMQMALYISFYKKHAISVESGCFFFSYISLNSYPFHSQDWNSNFWWWDKRLTNQKFPIWSWKSHLKFLEAVPWDDKMKHYIVQGLRSIAIMK